MLIFLKNALTGGPRRIRDFEVGQLVYFWRKRVENKLHFEMKESPEMSGFWMRPTAYSTDYIVCHVKGTSGPARVGRDVPSTKTEFEVPPHGRNLFGWRREV